LPDALVLLAVAESERPCVAHREVERSDLWYYRDADRGLEYLCADAYATLPDDKRLAWYVVPDDIT
jgi:hypothetical protein